MSKIFFILILLFSVQYALGQSSLTPVVVGSQGSTVSGNSGNTLQFTVGESIILTTTSATHTLTQGFNQPSSLLETIPLDVTYTLIDGSCIGIPDGSITVDSIAGCDGNYTISLNGTSYGTLTILDSLTPGSYLLEITSGDGCSFSEMVTINATGSDCDLFFYNAFSPNGDLLNDYWHIEKIESYPDNTVQVYDRWGVLVWETTDYNNQDNRWEGKNTAGNEMPDGTYFYIFQSYEIIQKGYIEITR